MRQAGQTLSFIKRWEPRVISLRITKAQGSVNNVVEKADSRQRDFFNVGLSFVQLGNCTERQEPSAAVSMGANDKEHCRTWQMSVSQQGLCCSRRIIDEAVASGASSKEVFQYKVGGFCAEDYENAVKDLDKALSLGAPTRSI